MTVVAEGAAAVEGSSNPREKAINDALRSAVMNAVGAYVSSTSLGSDYQEIEDRIIVKSQGFAVLDEVLEERTSAGIMRVKIRATVSTKPLALVLKGLGITHDWKVAVVAADSSSKKSGKTCISELEKALIKAGFRTIDKSWSDKLAEDESLARAEEGDREALSCIKQEYGVDVLVLADASAQQVDEQKQGGLRFIRSTATTDIKAFYTDTGEILTVLDSKATKLGETASLSAGEALKAAGKDVGAKLVDDLLAAPAELAPFVTVKVAGFNKASDAVRFERALRELPGVRSVKRQRFTKGVNELNVYVNREDLDSMAESIEEHEYMRPFNVVVESWSKAMITGRVQIASASAPHKGASYTVVPPK
jgi:hypothetical protein